jgi:hypothetical protein
MKLAAHILWPAAWINCQKALTSGFVKFGVVLSGTTFK